MRRYILKSDYFRKEIYSDEDVYNKIKNSRYEILYNKYELCKLLNYQCGLNDTPDYPVYVKPIINLKGMGVNSYLSKKKCKIDKTLFWTKYFTGEHLSSDFILINGKVKFSCYFRGYKKDDNFDYWENLENKSINYDLILKKEIREILSDYTGFLNIETINYHVIECHLRCGDIYLLPKIKSSLNLFFDQKVWNYSQDFDKFYLIPIFTNIIKVNISIVNQVYIILFQYKDYIKWFHLSFQEYYGVFRFIYFKISNLSIGLKVKSEILKYLDNNN